MLATPANRLNALRRQEHAWIEEALARHAEESRALASSLESSPELLQRGLRALVLARWACWREELLAHLEQPNCAGYDHRRAKQRLCDGIADLAGCLLADPGRWLDVPLQAVLHPDRDFDLRAALTPRARGACQGCGFTCWSGAGGAHLRELLAGLDVRDTSPSEDWRARYWACNGWN